MSESKDQLLARIRNKQPMSFKQQLRLTGILSMPAIITQLSSVLMQFIDASMVGRLGAQQAASVGLVATCTWLFTGFCAAGASGFSVQVAHLIGGENYKGARSVLRQGITTLVLFGILLALIGVGISFQLPKWLGGEMAIRSDASWYFLLYSAFLPTMQVAFMSATMLQSTGNMKVPSMLNILMCLLDVFFNFFLIFPTRDISFLGLNFTVFGFDMGVKGAALGTGLAELIAGGLLFKYLITKSPELKITKERGSFIPTRTCLRNALSISMPMGMQNIIMRGAHVISTIIIAPLGTIPLAANTFAITAESFCYMPGYGIADAATSLVGQCIGAGRTELAKVFAKISVYMGTILMTFFGIIMFITAPYMIGTMTTDPEVIALGAKMLRIEAFAEAMFAVSIVGYGACLGAGDTLVPSFINLGCIWVARIIPALILTPILGLTGFWIAMCLELNVRGILFIIRLKSGRWMKYTDKNPDLQENCQKKSAEIAIKECNNLSTNGLPTEELICESF